ncbi:hypothetical protein VTL71DRAFT_9444 [Oculimacula yallundae]|uniref:Uncharacterized protein n=1 Tax=Oculimacula yallundae TaxID=86028 RepID=A0ABR4BRX5_9HELO
MTAFTTSKFAAATGLEDEPVKAIKKLMRTNLKKQSETGSWDPATAIDDTFALNPCLQSLASDRASSVRSLLFLYARDVSDQRRASSSTTKPKTSPGGTRIAAKQKAAESTGGEVGRRSNLTGIETQIQKIDGSNLQSQSSPSPTIRVSSGSGLSSNTTIDPNILIPYSEGFISFASELSASKPSALTSSALISPATAEPSTTTNHHFRSPLTTLSPQGPPQTSKNTSQTAASPTPTPTDTPTSATAHNHTLRDGNPGLAVVSTSQKRRAIELERSGSDFAQFKIRRLQSQSKRHDSSSETNQQLAFVPTSDPPLSTNNEPQSLQHPAQMEGESSKIRRLSLTQFRIAKVRGLGFGQIQNLGGSDTGK